MSLYNRDNTHLETRAGSGLSSVWCVREGGETCSVGPRGLIGGRLRGETCSVGPRGLMGGRLRGVRPTPADSGGNGI